MAQLLAARPFTSADHVLQTSDAAADRVDRDGWLEAFRHHPRLGERDAERPRSGAAAQASAREQSGVDAADGPSREALAEANLDYERRFGHVFIVSAAGKSTAEVLDVLRRRMTNDPDTELRMAADEQKKITRQRLERLFG
jgi:OHCU decarboxylase